MVLVVAKSFFCYDYLASYQGMTVPVCERFICNSTCLTKLQLLKITSSLAGVTVSNVDAFTAPATTTTQDTKTPLPATTAAIIGGVVGGTVLIVIVIIIVLVVKKKQAAKVEQEGNAERGEHYHQH